jgi:hypothetical protein
MKEDAGLITSVLMPVIDTYKDAAAALSGCHSFGIDRECCELDVTLITNEERPSSSLRVGENYVDLVFLNEKEALKPSNPEIAASLAFAKPVKDANLIISTSVAASQALLESSLELSAQGRLTSCLKSLGRADESMGRENLRVANYWLLTASYEFAYAWLYHRRVVPSPSHIFSQMKTRSQGSSKDFEAFSLGAGLTRASRKDCLARLDGLALLYDLVGTRQQTAPHHSRPVNDVAFQIVRRKADFLASTMEHAESYSFLGLEVSQLIYSISSSRDVQEDAYSRGISVDTVLSQEKEGLLGDRLVRDLGLVRPSQQVKVGIEMCRERLSKLARII